MVTVPIFTISGVSFVVYYSHMYITRYQISGIIGLALLGVGIYVGATNSTVLRFFKRNATSTSAYVVEHPLGDALPASEMNRGGFGFSTQPVIESSPEQDPMSVEWKVYENTAYRYRLKYPVTMSVGLAQEMDPSSEQKSRWIQVTGSGVYVEVFTEKVSSDSQAEIRSFAEKARQKERSDVNENYPEKKVSDLQEVSFAQQQVFVYTVTGSGDGYGHNSHKYLYLGHQGSVIVVHYPINENLSQAIIDTFELTDDAGRIPLASTEDWLQYSNTKYGYSLKYPRGGDGLRTQEVNVVRIYVPRGIFGVVALGASSNDGEGVQFAESEEKRNQLLSLPLKAFVEQLQTHLKSLKGTETKYGPYPLIVGEITRTDIGGREGYTFTVSDMVWFGTPIGQILIPGNRDSNTYTFVENSKGQKFLLWYPSNDPSFETIRDTMKFGE